MNEDFKMETGLVRIMNFLKFSRALRTSVNLFHQDKKAGFGGGGGDGGRGMRAA